MNPLRNHKSYVASMGHRLSGLALALFLPFHFLLLGNALNGAAGLDAALVYTDNPLVKFAEWGLIMLLALHLFFGVRVLVLEFSRKPNHAETMEGWVVPSAAATALIGLLFLVQVF
jgi:fumarate reductase subunit D